MKKIVFLTFFLSSLLILLTFLNYKIEVIDTKIKDIKIINQKLEKELVFFKSEWEFINSPENISFLSNKYLNHIPTELIEFGWSARNRISEMRADHGEDYILGDKCSMHTHKGGVSMYKLNDQKTKIVSLGSSTTKVDALSHQYFNETRQAYGWYENLVKTIYG